MRVEPYLNFDGRCEEAIEFYKKAIDAKVTALMRFKDQPKQDPNCPGGVMPPETNEKIMHVSLQVGSSTMMASDCHCKGNPKFEGISLSLIARTPGEAERMFINLSESGKVCVPLGKTFFSESFGVVTDRFGVNWMIIVLP
jgi:PhnB protein